ncbi:acyltransferase family protein [Vreelandella venusta]|uniref:acyltransferase family protein n=1 Tax=Vreelandella venusta TaxID=44935 RepID=UPI00384B0A4C
MGKREQSAQQRNFGLDVVRALAIALVMLAHGTLLMADALSETSRRLLLYIGGYFGVELFFVLSGFLIGGLLIKLLCGPPDQPLWPQVARFWQRRWLRTLPNYYLFLLLNVTVFHYWFGTGETDWRHLLFLQNLAWPGSSLMPESWSLAVEEWFYLTIPLVLMGVQRQLGCSGARTVLYGMCGYIVLFAVLRAGASIVSEAPWDEGFRKVVLLRLDAIAWGALVAWLWHFKRQWVLQNVHIHALLGSALLLISGYWITTGVLGSFETYVHKTALFTATSAGAALLLPLMCTWSQGPRRWPWLTRCITRISLYSYSLYLVHFSLILPWLHTASWAQGWSISSLLILYVVLSMAAAALIYHLYERPMTNLRDR